jgi:hypothetical protein
MIVVVEGPSAAGKTTWAARMAPTTVIAEHAGLRPPPAGDHEAVARFWTDANARRWHAALQMEAATGTAVCDSDPLKLHYDFCLVRIGHAPMEQLLASVRTGRDAIAAKRIGIADLVLCNVPEPSVLEVRKERDTTRTRRSFELHRRLGEPLEEWYGALRQLDPERVQWGFPDALPTAPERPRYDLELFDAWMATLGIT